MDGKLADGRAMKCSSHACSVPSKVDGSFHWTPELRGQAEPVEMVKEEEEGVFNETRAKDCRQQDRIAQFSGLPENLIGRIHYRSNGKSYRCSGAFVDNRSMVLTAGHCCFHGGDNPHWAGDWEVALHYGQPQASYYKASAAVIPYGWLHGRGGDAAASRCTAKGHATRRRESCSCRRRTGTDQLSKGWRCNEETNKIEDLLPSHSYDFCFLQMQDAGPGFLGWQTFTNFDDPVWNDAVIDSYGYASNFGAGKELYRAQGKYVDQSFSANYDKDGAVIRADCNPMSKGNSGGPWYAPQINRVMGLNSFKSLSMSSSQMYSPYFGPEWLKTCQSAGFCKNAGGLAGKNSSFGQTELVIV